MDLAHFFSKLKQRKLVQWALAYVAAAFALLQGIDIVAQRFGWPEQTMRLLIVALSVGLFVTLVLAWYHGERGAQRVTGVELFILALLLVAGGAVLWRFAARSNQPRTLLVASPNENRVLATPATIPAKSIAVLPFDNLSDDKANAYFAEGVQDEILTRLARVADLKVISRTSTRRFKDSTDSVQTIAHQLGVVNILEGSVQKSNNQVRVNVQLIDAQNDLHRWAQTYDRTLDDVFAIEAEIARNIAQILQAKLTGAAERQLAERPTENPEAHRLCLQGSYYNDRGTEADYRRAIDCYKGAIKLDENYTQAYVGISFALTNLARKFLSGAEAQKTYAEARSAAAAALALKPDLAAAHSVRALSFESDFKWSEAEAEYRRALRLAPNDDGVQTALAGLLATLGRSAEAVELAQQELVNDPLCASCYHWLSMYLCSLGRLDEAEKAMQQAIDLQPGHADFYTQLTVIAILRGDANAALSTAQKEVAAGGWQEIALALAQQIGSDQTAADAALKELIEHQPDDAAYQIAQIYALRKEPDKVFKWLERAWSNRDPGIGELLYDPFLVRYKDDPRFATFCSRVGLPAPPEITTALRHE